MDGELKYVVDADTAREIKWWLKSCILSPSVATPLRFLNSAYEAQCGKALRADFRHVVIHLCPGLSTVERKGQLVVLGIAPRWTREDLIEALQFSMSAPTHAEVEDFLDGKEHS